MEDLLNVKKGNVDLHIHTRFSDGALSPEGVLSIAKAKRLSAISITDHDTLKAYPAAIQKGEEMGIEVVSGVELSCVLDGKDVHILGYFIDCENKRFIDALEEMRNTRYYRAKKIVRNLNEMGLDLRFETVLRFAGGESIGRPHIAEALIHEEYAYSHREAFERYLGYHCPAYVDKLQLTPLDAFGLIKDAGGVSVMGHPGITGIDHLIPELAQQGLCGLEVYHSEQNPTQQKHYLEICRQYNLLYTGGSDFHRKTRTREIGEPPIRYSLLETMKSRLKELHG